MIEIEKIRCPSDPGKPQKIRIRMTRPAETPLAPAKAIDPNEILLQSNGTDKLLDALFNGF